MSVNYNYIKMIGLLVFLITICSFSSIRNGDRKVSEPKVEFLGANNLFITSQDVSKLLIQKIGKGKNLTKKALDLNSLEQSLVKNPMVSTAEVYVDIEGELVVEVKQKQPIARVVTGEQFYIDADGGYMPLSKNYTERVPFITGSIKKSKLTQVYNVAKYISQDEFLKKEVVQIHQNNDGTIDLKLRDARFLVKLGDVDQLNKKINNLKAFYIKAAKDNVLGEYKKVNLQFDNQVVCTKV